MKRKDKDRLNKAIELQIDKESILLDYWQVKALIKRLKVAKKLF